ncbi:hypothetical protein [Herpetosiphon llansteffanensis]|uniref:hypothetical protein n=1 Tax=Herpetosiphon llansteffanensis TaxID=2094568 RepID=UPI00196A29CD|nr:hypothetical protein [Herpetosiphon llansteffanensis]
MQRFLGFMLISLLLLACGQTTGQNIESAANEIQVAQAVPTDKPTPKPTAKPRPTNTPRPTAKPKPTRTPRPTATATPIPEPVILTGVGQTVTDAFMPPSPVSIIKLTHTGRRNFIVKAYTDGGDESYLVNEIGNYTGSRVLYGDSSSFLEINADGEWTAEIVPIGFEAAAANGFSGTGDMVSGLFMPSKEGPIPFQFSHNGDSNFIVQVTCQGGMDYAQNEIGAVDGSAIVKFSEGPCLWDVQADGAWTISPK